MNTHSIVCARSCQRPSLDAFITQLEFTDTAGSNPKTRYPLQRFASRDRAAERPPTAGPPKRAPRSSKGKGEGKVEGECEGGGGGKAHARGSQQTEPGLTSAPLLDDADGGQNCACVVT